MHTDLKKRKKKSHRRMRLKMQLDASLFMKKKVDTSSFAGISPKRILLN